MNDNPIPPGPLREKLEDMETQYGAVRGKLAMAMDLMSDAEITAGALAVYCRNGLDPRRSHPDLETLQRILVAVRGLVKGAFREGEKQE